ncbi:MULTISPECIES: ATP-binding protein [unclassified Frankia]|uniref:AAA family ATPase n=1 Tax=unclassified Frankia TaxID=2632575 RepID=UPI002AD5A2D8|nr:MULTISPECIES: ATP-binding protein [unclassified Frankia]
MPAKPPELFGRDAEWFELTAFAGDPTPGATLALVYGRRRQGKTLILELLCEAVGGFMVTGVEQSDAQNLADLAAAFTRFTGSPYPVAFTDWGQAVDALFRLGEQRDTPLPVVLDEFPYLVAQNSAIPSLIQNALSPRGRARQHSRTRLILCGSALTLMQGLLAASAPLRGRAITELMLHPFDFRDAAGLWGLTEQPDVALRVHALVGGTPAYRDFCARDAPEDAGDVDPWVVRRLLNPAGAMFREGRVLLAEEAGLTNPAPYYAVLAAIARGRTRRGEIANELGRDTGGIHHALTVLTDAHLVTGHQDAFHARRTSFTLAEPVLRLHQLVIRPQETRLSLRRGAEVWAELADTVSARIYGPHFEDIARTWSLAYACVETLGGRASRVQPAVLRCPDTACPAREHEIDTVVIEVRPNEPDRVLAIGEAKWRATPVDVDELARLRHIRSVLPGSPANVKLLLFSRAGFTTTLTADAAAAPDVELVDLDRLYTGS